MIKQDTLENQANIVFLAIGSNLGNRKQNIEKAKFFLERNSLKILKSSSIYESYSWPNKNHPKFYNIVIKIISYHKPPRLFEVIKKIEKMLGRKFSKINSPRTCDIDIIDFNGLSYNLNVSNHYLTIPHPRLENRNFVLFPLYEIEKNWKHPIKKIKIQDLIKNLDNASLYSIKQI